MKEGGTGRAWEGAKKGVTKRSKRVSWMGGGEEKERRWEEGRGGTDRGGRVGAVRQVD